MKTSSQCMVSNTLDSDRKWIRYPHLPVCSLRQALSRFLEIAKPPSAQLLKIMARYASDPKERETLAKLGQVGVGAQAQRT